MNDTLRPSRSFYLWTVTMTLAVFGCSDSGAGTAEMPTTPDGTVMHVAAALADNRPQVLWRAAPAKYQQDMTGLVHGFADKVDKELWNMSFGLLQKLTHILDEKREFIFQHPMLAQQMKENPSARDNWESIVQMLDTLVNSELADLDKLRSIDIESFLSGTGAELMVQLSDAMALNPDADFKVKLRSIKASVVSSEGDTAIVKIEMQGESSKQEQFARVGGRWVPKDMADQWDDQIAEAREKLAQWSPDDQQKQQQMNMLKMVDTALDNLQAAQTPEAFNATLQQSINMAMMMAMSMGDLSPAIEPDESPPPMQ